MRGTTDTEGAVTELSTPGVTTLLCPQQLWTEFVDSSFKKGGAMASANRDGNG